jgi:hypothetical protein
MLAEAQVRLDQFLSDHVGEDEEASSPVEVATAPAKMEYGSSAPVEFGAPVAAEIDSAAPVDFGSPAPVEFGSSAPTAAEYAVPAFAPYVEPAPDYDEPASDYEPTPALESPLEPELAEPEFSEPELAEPEPVHAELPGNPEESYAPPPLITPSGSFATAPDRLLLTPLASDGDQVRYRVTGPLTFARIMALEHALQSLEGVSGAFISPEGGDAATIAFVAQDPARAIEDLLRAPGLPLELAWS